MTAGLQGMSQGMGGANSAASVAANAAHLMQFNPLLYAYQLQMAHQALGNKKSCKLTYNTYVVNFTQTLTLF